MESHFFHQKVQSFANTGCAIMDYIFLTWPCILLQHVLGISHPKAIMWATTSVFKKNQTKTIQFHLKMHLYSLIYHICSFAFVPILFFSSDFSTLFLRVKACQLSWQWIIKIHHSWSQETGAMDLWREHKDQHRHTSGACSALINHSPDVSWNHTNLASVLSHKDSLALSTGRQWGSLLHLFQHITFQGTRNPQHVTLHSCISINSKALI